MDEITNSALDDFLYNPVWKRIKEELGERQEALFHKLLDCPLDEAEPLRIEYKLITQFLNKPQEYRDELKEV